MDVKRLKKKKRICLPMWGTWVLSLVKELRSHVFRQLSLHATTVEPALWSLWATTREPKHCNKRSHVPLLLAAAKSRQLCPTLCNPIDGSPPGSPVPGILQARTLEWVAISFSNAWKWKVNVKSLSCVWLLATPWIAAHQAPLSMGFSRQEYWSGVPLPSPTCYTKTQYGQINKYTEVI